VRQTRMTGAATILPLSCAMQHLVRWLFAGSSARECIDSVPHIRYAVASFGEILGARMVPSV